MERHTLIIGGTGMLKGASMVLAGKSHVLTSVARTSASLQALDAALEGFTGVHHMLSLDWSDPAEFLSVLASHAARVGHPTLVVAWLHDEELARAVAARVAGQENFCRFFHIRSSSAVDPAGKTPYGECTFAPVANVGHHQIILGFHITCEGSRWLTHAEIASGVLVAIGQQEDTAIVGTVSPWENRP